MGKIAINPNRLQWCMNTDRVNLILLSKKVHIAKRTLEQVMENQAVLSVSQLKKIANFFKRSLLFFLDPNEAREEKIYSLQFRTINNQKPISSPKLRAFIERVEKQREIYIGLMEDLENPLKNWYPDKNWNIKNIKSVSAEVSKWLKISKSDDFYHMRKAVENKGIMVIVSNGKWQIEKDNPVRGFSLYYDIVPVIVVKKQLSKGAQAFTLMHELAHLLLHKKSAIDDEKDFNSDQGMEKEANEFAEEFKPQSTVKKDNKIPRTYRYREPISVFGKPFVYAVFDSLYNKNITLAKASTYLDNLKISDVRKLEQHV